MPTKLLDNRINQIAERTGCTLSRKEGKFNLSFEIRNLDFSRYTLNREEPGFKLIASCELMEGTSDKPSYLSGNTATQNRYSIVCKYKTQNSIPSFSIYESELFRKIFKKKTIDIKCKDHELRNYIHGLPEIELLTNKVKESAEISPAINCKKNELTILFQTFTIELELFEAMVNFVYKINTEYNQSN